MLWLTVLAFSKEARGSASVEAPATDSRPAARGDRRAARTDKGAKGFKDDDHDGLDDKTADPCPGQPETVNGYKDDDGCPDELPQLQFVAKRGDADEPGDALVVTGPDGARHEGQGQVVVAGLPGQTFTATARSTSCYGGSATAQIPASGSATVAIQIGRVDGLLQLVITDVAGRELDGAEARYLVDDDACAPIDTAIRSGHALHSIGAGPVTVFLTAPGYGVYQSTITLEPGERHVLETKLAPTQVALKDGELRSARPLQFSTGSAISGSSEELLGQMASLMLSSDAQRFQIEAWAERNGTVQQSQERADAVVDYLVSVGVPRDRLVAVGKGPMKGSQKDELLLSVAP